MKKIMILVLALTLICLPVMAEELPDAGVCLKQDGLLCAVNLDMGGGYVCDLWAFDQDSRTVDGILMWLAVAEEFGYRLADALVEGRQAFEAKAPDGRCAYLVPDYDGMVVLLVERGMEYNPVRVVEDDPQPQTQHGYMEVDCPYCYGGRCPQCNGSGIYRNYGVSVSCDLYCAGCDGRGTVTRYY